ncbi:MAG: hypothetical protein ACRD68_12735, partial [Pyrinomonadaceae bacterium]
TAPPNAGTPAAIISGLLILAEKNVKNPQRVVIQIPVYANAPLNPGDAIEGYFGIDLADHLPKPLSEATYYAYLMVGEYMDGPHKLVIAPGTDTRRDEER